MKIATFNINGIKARTEALPEWLDAAAPGACQAFLLPRMPYPLFDHLARRPCDWETAPQPDGRAVVTIRRNASHDQS